MVNEGENRVAEILLGATPVDGVLYLGLYKDVTEPPETSVLGDLTEVSGFGYGRITLTRGVWVITDDLAEYAQQVFLASGGAWGDVYGYFVGTSSDNSGKLMWIEHFASYYYIEDGKGIKVTPKVRVA